MVPKFLLCNLYKLVSIIQFEELDCIDSLKIFSDEVKNCLLGDCTLRCTFSYSGLFGILCVCFSAAFFFFFLF